jgi:outer membrane protein TolC
MRAFLASSLIAMASFTVAEGLSFEKAVKTGVARSSRLEEARAAVKEAAGVKSRAQTALQPWLGFTGTATALDRTLAASLGPISVVGANQWQSRLLLDANVAIDISGDLKGQVRLADLDVQAAMLRYLVARAELVRDVKSAYLQSVQTDELLKSARATLRNAEDRRGIVRQLLTNGVLTPFDTLRTDTEVADAQQRVTSAENRKRVAYAGLAMLIEAPVETLEGLPSQPAAEVGEGPPLVEEALSRRAEIGLARLQIRAEELGIRLAGGSSRPSLTAGLQAYTLSNPSTFEPSSPLAAASLILRFPILDRGEGRARRKEAEGRLEGARAVLSRTEQGIRFQSVEAESRLIDASERVSVAEKALALAEEAYRISLVRLKAGLTQGSLSPILEVSDTETALTQARNNLINARTDRLLALVQIEYVRFGFGGGA